MPTIGGLCNLLGVFGPLGPKVGVVVCQFMFTMVLYICVIRWVSLGRGVICQFVLTLVLYNHANNWGDMCNLLGVFGPFGPKVR